MKMNLHKMLVAFATTFACITASAQEDCTSKITNPNFDAKDFTGWDMQKPQTFGSAPSTGVKATSTSNPVVTAYSTTFDCKQTVEGLTPGIYKLSVQAFARPISTVADIWTAYKAGKPTAHDNVFYGNTTEKKVMLIIEDYCTTLSGGTEFETGKFVPMSSNTTSAAFSQDPIHYDQYLYCEVGEDGKLTLGVKATGCDGSYYGYDNFRLYGPIAAIPAEDVTALVATAPTGAMNAAVKDAMGAAIKALQANASVSNFDAVVKAIDAAKTSINMYKEVKAAWESIEASLTVAALDVFQKNETVSTIKSQYENSSLEGDGKNYIQSLQDAAAEARRATAPSNDLTSLIVNPGFDDNSSSAQSGWTLVSGAAKGKWSKGTENRGFSCNNIKCELTQTVEGLEPGKYMLKYQAFGRMKPNADSWASYLAGEDLGSTNVYMIANEAKKEVMNVVYGATPTKGSGTWTTVTAADGSSLYLLDNSGAVADAFAQGLYQDSLITVVGADGKLTITFLKESEQDSSSDYSKYAGCDNFRLYRVVDGPAAQTDRIAIPAGSGNGSELTVTVLEQDEAGNTLSAMYTIKNGTWGSNASHLSIFKFAPLSAETIADYEKIVVEFDREIPASTGSATYGFIPVGLVSPVGWTKMGGLDKWEYTFTDENKTKGIEDFSIFFNASGDLKDIEFAIKGIYLVKPYSATVTEAGYATVAFVHDMAVPEGVKAYTVSGVEGSVLTLAEVSAIPANTGVVLEAAAGNYKFAASENALLPVQKNMLTAAYAGNDIAAGNYVLQSQNEKVGFYKLAEVRKAVKDCAYLSVPAAAAGVKAFFFDADEETAIETIEVLTSGKAQIYDLNGRKLNSLQKGINIVNGKKVLVK